REFKQKIEPLLGALQSVGPQQSKHLLFQFAGVRNPIHFDHDEIRSSPEDTTSSFYLLEDFFWNAFFDQSMQIPTGRDVCRILKPTHPFSNLFRSIGMAVHDLAKLGFSRP